MMAYVTAAFSGFADGLQQLSNRSGTGVRAPLEHPRPADLARNAFYGRALGLIERS
jgi:hypothetical protein